MKQKISERRLHPAFFAAFLLLIVGFLLFSILSGPNHESFNNEPVYELDAVWYTADGSFTALGLPEHFPCDENGTVTVCTTLPPNDGHQISALSFRASQNQVRIWVDGELLLEQGQVRDATPFIGKSPGSSWVLLSLPDDFYGKELRIELTSPYKNYQGLLPQVYLGTKSALLYHIIQMRAVQLAIASILLLVSILLLCFYLLLLSRKIKNRQILLLGTFGLLASIWLFGESQVLQLFTGRLLSWFCFTMITLHLLPIPILLIAADLPNFAYRRFCICAARFMMFYLSVLIVLQALGIRDFMEMLTLSLVILLCLCASFTLLIFRDFLHNKNQKILTMTIALSVLGLFACAELIYDLIDVQTYVGSFIQTGILAFYLVFTFSALYHAMELFERGLQTSYYRKLSYIDQMTDCLNRRAFIERENTWTAGNADGLIMIDLNRVKQVNDTLGHRTGDKYIIACSDAMHEVFEQRGDCFRLGGDEFLFWCNHATLDELVALEQQFIAAARVKCQPLSPLCSIATGTAVFSSEDVTIEDTYKRADHNMYRTKWLMKEAEYFAAQKKAEEAAGEDAGTE